ncbi:MAG: hypothetical protein ACYTFA_02420 [Planctomycetota bacterium]|jgi:hypothetical protein
MMKKPKVLSALGLAASVALVASLLSPWSAGPTVQAAVIMEKLSEQIEKNPLIDVTLDSISVDEAFVNGRLQVSKQGVAGDIEVAVREEGKDPEVEVNMSLGLSDGGGWVFIRELKVDDPQAQAVINMFLPAGDEVLIVLPEDAVGSDFGIDLGDELGELGSDKVVGVLQELIDSHADYGATIEHLSDGTILLTLPIDDAEALAALEGLAERAHGIDDEQIKSEVHDAMREHHRDHDDEELIGSTLTVVYDPAAELVRSFGIENLGSTDGRINVTIGEGEIDPALFDSSRVTTPNTRTLDLNALKSMFEGFEFSTD